LEREKHIGTKNSKKREKKRIESSISTERERNAKGVGSVERLVIESSRDILGVFNWNTAMAELVANKEGEEEKAREAASVWEKER
jgi:hypothetical protein